MDDDTARLVKRLIDTWDDDLGELIRLVELVKGVRARAMAFERELCARIAESATTMYIEAGDLPAAHVGMEIARLIRGRVKP